MLKQSILDKLSKFAQIKYQNLNKKLEALSKPEYVITPKQNNFQFHDPVINLTNKHFTNDELNQIAIAYKSNVTNTII